MQVAFFITPVDSVIWLRAMNPLNNIPLSSCFFCVIKNTLLGTLPHHMNVTPQCKELSINKVSAKEIIHWYFHPLSPQAPICLPNQNQNLKFVPFLTIIVYLADVTTSVGVTWHVLFNGAKYVQKFWHMSKNFFCPIVHESTENIYMMHRGVKNNPRKESKEDPNPGCQNPSILCGTLFIWMHYYLVPLHYSSTKAWIELSTSLKCDQIWLK